MILREGNQHQQLGNHLDGARRVHGQAGSCQRTAPVDAGDLPWLTADEGTPRARALSTPTSRRHARTACFDAALRVPDLQRQLLAFAIDQRALSVSDGPQTA